MEEVKEFPGELEGIPYKITQNPDGTHILWDEYGNYTYEFTGMAWREMWVYYFHGNCGLSSNEFAVMLCRSHLVFLFLQREYISDYHHQRFWLNDKEE